LENIKLYEACSENNKELALLAISEGANNFNNCFLEVCAKGYKEIVELLISLECSLEWNQGLWEASYDNHKEIMLLMIEKGAYIDNAILLPEDIYNLYLRELPRDKFGKYKNIYDQCKLFHSCFYNNMFQILSIEDLAKIVVNY
jgi:hypothetical protein